MLCTRGFTSNTAKKAIKVRSDNAKDDLIKYLQKENARLNYRVNDYKNKYIKKCSELQDFIEANSNIYKLSEYYPNLYRHIKSLNLPKDNENDSKWKNGNRFDQDSYPLYILLSMAGEYYTDILHRNFGFPSSRQIRSMKHKYKLKYGITDEILDGSYESICKMDDPFVLEK